MRPRTGSVLGGDAFCCSLLLLSRLGEVEKMQKENIVMLLAGRARVITESCGILPPHYLATQC